MALVLGTNCGFVATPPVADPGGTLTIIDAYDMAVKDVVPGGVTTILEIGWWCNNNTEEANFEVGLYSHHVGNDKPDARLFVDNVNAKGTDAGWKIVSVNWAVTPGTTYWIAIQVDDTDTITETDYSITADRVSTHTPSTALPNPWDAGSNEATWVRGIYASSSAGVDYTELSGTIAAQSVVENANLSIGGGVELSGTIAAQSTVGPSSLGSETVDISQPTAVIKRLVVAGNNQIWYEAI
jgi:hypothetical protein